MTIKICANKRTTGRAEPKWKKKCFNLVRAFVPNARVCSTCADLFRSKRRVFITRNRRTQNAFFYTLFSSTCRRRRVPVVIVKLKFGSGRDSSHELFNRVNCCTALVAAASAGAYSVRWDMRPKIQKRMPMNTFSISMDDGGDDDGTRRASHFAWTRIRTTHAHAQAHTCLRHGISSRPTGCCCLICNSHCVTKNNCMIWWQYCRLSASVSVSWDAIDVGTRMCDARTLHGGRGRQDEGADACTNWNQILRFY